MKTPVLVSPSLLAANFARLGEEVRRAGDAGADALHLDIMDGHFVPNLTIGPAVVKALRPLTKLPFDVHLMLSRPEDFFEPFVRAGADSVTFHLEARPEPEPLLARLRALGVKTGLSVNPDTPVERLAECAGLADRLLLMTVRPGFGGQVLVEGSLTRATHIRDRLRQGGFAGVDLQVDGGVTVENAAALRQAGATNLVAGTALFAAPDMSATIRALRACPKDS